MRETINIQI